MALPESESAFKDRRDAGRRLAVKLEKYAGEPDLLVLALPRGGVPVAYEIAQALSATLDVFLVRKLGLPGHEELAMGAIASGGARVLNENVVSMMQIDSNIIDIVAAHEGRILRQRELKYRGDRPRPTIQGCTVILVDDGLATGASMRAAVMALREQRPKRLIVAVPVAPPETCAEIRSEVDEIVCALTPQAFFGVGLWYEDFSQTTDEEVCELLRRKTHRVHPENQLPASH